MANLTTKTALETAPKAMQLIEGAEEITKGIKAAEKTGKTLQAKWHLLACSIIAHIEKHRATGVNADMANALINTLPAGVRKNALTDWFCAFGAVSFNDETKKLRYDKDQKTLQIAGEAKPFWEYKPEPEYKAFDFDKAVANLLKSIAQHTEKKNSLDKLPTPEALELLKRLAPKA